MVRTGEGIFECQDCEAKAEIPFEQGGEMHYVREERNLPGLFLPAVSLIPFVLSYFHIGPVAWMQLITIVAYVFVDSVIWSFKHGIHSLLRSVLVRLILVTTAGFAYWGWLRFA